MTKQSKTLYLYQMLGDGEIKEQIFTDSKINPMGWYEYGHRIELCPHYSVDTCEIVIGEIMEMFFTAPKTKQQIYTYFTRVIDRKIKEAEIEHCKYICDLEKKFDFYCDKIEELEKED